MSQDPDTFLYYGIGEQDDLDCDFFECVGRFVDELQAEDAVCRAWSHFGMPVPAAPDSVDVITYRQGAVSTAGLRPLETLLEQLEERHGYQAEHDPTPTPGMVRAEEEFLRAVAGEYRRAGWVKECAPVGTERVDLTRWLGDETSESD